MKLIIAALLIVGVNAQDPQTCLDAVQYLSVCGAFLVRDFTASRRGLQTVYTRLGLSTPTRLYTSFDLARFPILLARLSDQTVKFDAIPAHYIRSRSNERYGLLC